MGPFGKGASLDAGARNVVFVHGPREKVLFGDVEREELECQTLAEFGWVRRELGLLLAVGQSGGHCQVWVLRCQGEDTRTSY